MTDMNKISFEALENIAGGGTCTVANDAANYADLREKPGLNAKVIFKIPNGEKVFATGKKVNKDGFVWYEVLCNQYPNGWIAGSLIDF